MNPTETPTVNPMSAHIVANVLHFRDAAGRRAMLRLAPEEKTRLLAQGFRQEPVPNRQAARAVAKEHAAYFAARGQRPKHGTPAQKEAARRAKARG